MTAGYTVVAAAAIAVLLLLAAASPGDDAQHAASPIASALGSDGPDPPDLQLRQAIAVADMTAACMTRLGWHYTPDPEPVPVIPDPGLPPVPWAERWGFGVSTAAGGAPPSPLPDRNADHAAALSPTRRAQYLAALHGSTTGPGCHPAAVEAVHGVRERALEPLRGAFADLASTIDADPSMVEVRSRWMRCVRDATRELGLASTDLDRRRLVGRLLDAFAAQTARSGTPAELVAVRARERRVAVGVARCEAAFSAGYARVARPHELRFVREHRTALAAARSELQAAEARLPAVPP